jgi:predicted ATP-grasp superfamily ATP-dependent carboligase
MVPTRPFIPDPEGAAILLKTLNKIYNLSIDIQPLLERGREIKQKLKEIAETQRVLVKKETQRSRVDEPYVV